LLSPAVVRAASSTQPGSRVEALGGPRVAVVEVGDHGVEQLGRDRADRAQLVDGGQRDDAVADQLLRALGQLEDLHARVTRLLGQPSACAAPSSVRPRSSIARRPWPPRRG
jgi:hypothetical protein